MKKMRICRLCSRYTLERMHCAKATSCAHPPRFDPNDRYGRYRRRLKGV